MANKFNIKSFGGFVRELGIQPILTVVLIIIILFFAIYFFQSGNNNQAVQEVDLTKKLSFEDAVNNFLSNDYEVYTQGVLYVKSKESQDINTSVQSTPTPSVTQISLVENKYDDVFFLLQNGKVVKIDAKTFGINGSIFFNQKGNLVFLDNVQKQYTLYKVPADTEKDAVDLFAGVKAAMDQNIFPLTPLINDYKDKKFNPTLYSTAIPNIYTGKWQHPVYTNGEVVTIVIRTDPSSGVFNAMTISATNPPSEIYFDFRKKDNIDGFDNIPSNYKSIPVPVDYKTKE